MDTVIKFAITSRRQGKVPVPARVISTHPHQFIN